MRRILGLDLGTNSIGWAIMDDSSNKIIDCGTKVFPSYLNNERRLARKRRRIDNRFVQRTLIFNQLSVLLRRANSVILTLIFGSFITALLTILNFSNWQFWFNSFLTILIATLTLLHTNNKK
jgi:CRISPR/Cas system Type II protein with McrA/HNH and RuvC-like nuclease domain